MPALQATGSGTPEGAVPCESANLVAMEFQKPDVTVGTDGKVVGLRIRRGYPTVNNAAS